MLFSSGIYHDSGNANVGPNFMPLSCFLFTHFHTYYLLIHTFISLFCNIEFITNKEIMLQYCVHLLKLTVLRYSHVQHKDTVPIEDTRIAWWCPPSQDCKGTEIFHYPVSIVWSHCCHCNVIGHCSTPVCSGGTAVN